MVLSDRSIREELEAGRLVIDPLEDGAIQPASVDLRLGHQLRVFQHLPDQIMDVKQEMPHLTLPVEIDEVNPFVLHPGEFALGVTLEEVHLPSDIVGRLDGKSSLGRLGLVVHSTAGFVDPGWRGRLTLELSNLANLPIYLHFGMRISQLSFMRLTTPAEHPYGSRALGSKYQGQMEPTPSRYFESFIHSPAPPDRRTKRAPEAAVSLRLWLQESEFQGSVSHFAASLGITLKTVENWVYSRTNPSRRFRPNLYAATGLSQFQVTQLGLPDPEP